MGKYGEALGVWELRIGGASVDLRPRMGDNRSFRNVMMNPRFKDEPAARLDAFEDWFLALLQRDCPPKDDRERDEQRWFVELNAMQLFEETMIKFRWTTREEMEKSKSESLRDLKKSIGGS